MTKKKKTITKRDYLKEEQGIKNKRKRGRKIKKIKIIIKADARSLLACLWEERMRRGIYVPFDRSSCASIREK